jgi:hypothetical protein
VWEVTAGEKLTIPLVHTRRSEFSGSILQLKTSGDRLRRQSSIRCFSDADQSEAVLDHGSENAAGRLSDCVSTAVLWRNIVTIRMP